MVSIRSDRPTSPSKKNRGLPWPFGHKDRKNKSSTVRETKSKSATRGAATNGTPPSSTSSPHHGNRNGAGRQQSMDKSLSSHNGQHSNGTRMHRLTSTSPIQPRAIYRAHRSEHSDTQSLPSRFRPVLAPAKLHAMPHSPQTTTKTISYKVPMKGGSESDRGSPRLNLSRKLQAQSDTPARARPRGTAWLCNSDYFRKICDAAFESTDLDQSGFVDQKELYSGLLLVHLKLGMYLGSAACKPLEREKCKALFEKMDTNHTGTLNKVQFQNVMMFLFGNVLLRVMVQWTATIAIVPIVAQHVLDWIYYAWEQAYRTISTLDDHYVLANWIEVALKAGFDLFLRCIPGSILLVISELGDIIHALPNSVWNTLPRTLVSSIIGIAVVPWIIFSIDDFFQLLASRSMRRK